MAASKVIATTWTKKDLLAKLKATLKRMDDEIEAWEKDNATIKKRQDAWDKKAFAWLKKNISSAEINVNNTYRNTVNFSVQFDQETVEKAIGPRPEPANQPYYKNSNRSYYSRNNDVSEYEAVENAIALVEGSKDTEYKITSSSAWAQLIR